MTRPHPRRVQQRTRWGTRTRVIDVKGSKPKGRGRPARRPPARRNPAAIKPPPPVLRPQVRRAGRNAQRGYRAHRRGHTWRRDALVALAVLEVVIALAFGVVEAVLTLVGVVVVLGFVAGLRGHRQATKASARRRATGQGAAT